MSKTIRAEKTITDNDHLLKRRTIARRSRAKNPLDELDILKAHNNWDEYNPCDYCKLTVCDHCPYD